MSAHPYIPPERTAMHLPYQLVNYGCVVSLVQVSQEALSALAVCVRDPSVGLQLVQRVCCVLDGSAEGKVKVAAERVALTAALAALADMAAAQPGMQEVATAAATFCSTFYKDERESTAVSCQGTKDCCLKLVLACWADHVPQCGQPTVM